MIEINRKEDCVGCNACVQKCPVHCISMCSDEQGFQYPRVDAEKCINCGLCEKVCPVINQNEPERPVNVYAGWNTYEKVRLASSSGGVFFSLAKRIIDEGGIVFGAKFNKKWEVVHSYADTTEGIKEFIGSKYVQSKIGNCYLYAEKFLKAGRKVLFSGTPCQIAGLKRFLRKDYADLLLTVDVVCHGVPSPGIWKEYLNHITRPKGASKNTESQTSLISMDEIPSIEGISFRDKRLGWEKYGIAILYAAPKGGKNSESQSSISKDKRDSELFESHGENIFMQGFLKDLYLRPSCYECPAKCGKSHSDITLADFWGIKKYYPNLYSEEGISLILSKTERGERSLNDSAIRLHPVSYADAVINNPAIEKSAVKPQIYESFWKYFEKDGIHAISKTIQMTRPSMIKRCFIKLWHLYNKIK